MLAWVLLILVGWNVVKCKGDPITVPIYSQSFQETFECPPNSHCIFHCDRHYAACLSSNFQCTQNNICQLNCLSESSCSYLSFNCAADSNCWLNCSGPGSCAFVEVDKLVGIQTYFSNDSGVRGFNVTSTLSAILSKSFARNGYQVVNFLFTGEYRVQMLSEDIPDDNETLTVFIQNITDSLNEELDATSFPNWHRPPSFVLKKTYQYILTMFYDYIEVTGWAFTTYLDMNFPGLSRYLTVYHVDLDSATSKIFIHFKTTFNFSIFFGNFRSGLTSFLLTLFKYPNSTFVDVGLYQPNNSYLLATAALYPYHCVPPVPFWGTYCLDTFWYSSGDISLPYTDLVASQTVHDGNLSITDKNSLFILGGSLITNNLILSSNANLQASTTQLTVSQSIILNEYSSIEISSSELNITANSIHIGDATQLVVNLNDDQLQLLQLNGSISIPAFNTNSLSGSFSTIVIKDTKGPISTCADQNYYNQSLMIKLFACPGGNVIPKELIAGITGGLLGFVSLFSVGSYLMYKRRDRNNLRSLEENRKTAS